MRNNSIQSSKMWRAALTHDLVDLTVVEEGKGCTVACSPNPYRVKYTVIHKLKYHTVPELFWLLEKKEIILVFCCFENIIIGNK
jgi:hypothetical protein